MKQNAISKNSSVLAVDSLTVTANAITSSSAGIYFVGNGSNNIKFTNGTSNIFNMTSDGYKTNPLLPGFLAYASADVLNVTGNAADVVVGFNTEVYDSASNFASNVFTAPVTGKYLFMTNVTFTGLSALMTTCRLRIITSLDIFERKYNAYNNSNTGTNGSLNLCVSTEMIAADTAEIHLQISNGAGNTADIAGGSELITYFCGQQLS